MSASSSTLPSSDAQAAASASANGTSQYTPTESSSPATGSTALTQNVCAHCKKQEASADAVDSPTLKPCISCKSVLYCSRECKKADTKQHKKKCAALAQEYFKTAEVKMVSRAPPKADTHRGGLQKWQFDT